MTAAELKELIRTAKVEVLTPDELAARMKIPVSRVYTNISDGEWGANQGIFHLGNRTTRIVWEIFFRDQVMNRLEAAPGR